MSQPRLLDLFCRAGGAAMGYHRAGFEVVGVDVVTQRNYPFTFFRADALDVLAGKTALSLGHFDAIHASPPCQHYAPVTAWRGDQDDHPDLLESTIALLQRTGLPWVVENVPHSPMRPCFVLCGSMFGLPIRRHRWFLTSWRGFDLMQPCRHSGDDLSFDHGGKQPESAYRAAMGCDWMTVAESRDAIPPAYTEWIGRQLLTAIEEAA